MNTQWPYRELGEEERQQGVGVLLLAVGQGLRHRVPGVKTSLQRGPVGGVSSAGLDGVIQMLQQRVEQSVPVKCLDVTSKCIHDDHYYLRMLKLYMMVSAISVL